VRCFNDDKLNCLWYLRSMPRQVRIDAPGELRLILPGLIAEIQ